MNLLVCPTLSCEQPAYYSNLLLFNINKAQLSVTRRVGRQSVNKEEHREVRINSETQPASEVTDPIEFITRVIHRQTFNMNRDIMTDTKMILGDGAYGLIISPRDGSRREGAEAGQRGEKQRLSPFLLGERQTVRHAGLFSVSQRRCRS